MVIQLEIFQIDNGRFAINGLLKKPGLQLKAGFFATLVSPFDKGESIMIYPQIPMGGP